MTKMKVNQDSLTADCDITPNQASNQQSAQPPADDVTPPSEEKRNQLIEIAFTAHASEFYQQRTTRIMIVLTPSTPWKINHQGWGIVSSTKV